MNILSTRIKSALDTSFLHETRKSFSLYPSSASITLSNVTRGKTVVGSCLRQQYYRQTNSEQTNSVNTDVKISSMIGDYISEMVKHILDNSGFLCNLQRIAAEHSFYIPEINVSGRCDFLGYDKANNEYIGIEVKSVGEYKANKCIEKPAEEHVLQSLIYLNHYREAYPTLDIKKWYILYISRSENYAIKSRKHGSPLTMIWDFYVTIDPEDKAAIIHSNNGKEKWADFNIDNVYSRYRALTGFLNNGILPPRDYQLHYDEETVADMYKKGELTRKVDIEKVEKWLKKGAPSGKLKVDLGDIECSFCAYKALCWPGELADPKPVEPDLSKLQHKDITTKLNNDEVHQSWI